MKLRCQRLEPFSCFFFTVRTNLPKLTQAGPREHTRMGIALIHLRGPMSKIFPGTQRRSLFHLFQSLQNMKCRRHAHRTWLSSGLLALFFGLSACAHISFHDPNDPQRRNVGVEYYKLKLYLLVTTMKEGYKADILTLPDLAQPRYALLHSGYGSSNLSLKLSNGILTDVGQQVDTKIPETITALGSLATAAAGFAKLVEGAAVRGEERPFRLFEIIMRQGELKLKEVKIEP